MAEIDEVGLAALDLMIAKSKQDPAFIDVTKGIIFAVDLTTCEIETHVQTLTDAIERVVDGVGGTSGDVSSIAPDEMADLAKGSSLDTLLALREKMIQRMKKG